MSSGGKARERLSFDHSAAMLSHTSVGMESPMSFSMVAEMSSIIFERIPSMASSEQTDLRWLLVSLGLLQRGQLWDSRRPQELRYALVAQRTCVMRRLLVIKPALVLRPSPPTRQQELTCPRAPPCPLQAWGSVGC